MIKSRWRRSGSKAVLIRSIGIHDALAARTFDVGLGRKNAEVVELPEGVRSVRIERPVRERVDLGRLCGGPPSRTTSPAELVRRQRPVAAVADVAR